MFLNTEPQDQTKDPTPSKKPATRYKQSHGLIEQYQNVRRQSMDLARGLSEADLSLQSMLDASPIKWHLAHTTWFFETFILMDALPHYTPFNKHFSYLFNSYYNGVGEQFPRAQRGLQSKPSIEEIHHYRQCIDNELLKLLSTSGDSMSPSQQFLIELGLHHEQQHQELIVTDYKHALSFNPLNWQSHQCLLPGVQTPCMELSADLLPQNAPSNQFTRIDQGLYQVGCDGAQFHYDNEGASHQVFLETFEIANTTVSNGEFIEFIEDGGYKNPELWLSEAWAAISQQKEPLPLYWRREGDDYFEFTLRGKAPLDPKSSLCHISYYEADAFTRWRGMRLPTEFEWEVAARAAHTVIPKGNFLDDGHLHPSSKYQNTPNNFFGNVWEWTQSAYGAYPGFKPFTGTAGEYNGKFMCNQFVLRGGSCATPASHIRHSYRNFFYPHQNWQFSGLRLARSL